MDSTHNDKARYIDARNSNFNVFPSTGTETLLTLLKPVRQRRFPEPCMKGTREGVFRKIDNWLDDGVHNILWISGCPGVGKSAVMSSLESRLRTMGRFGASFFFDRSDSSFSDPAALWRTVAFELARERPSMAQRLIKNIREARVDPGRPDIELHFKYLIREPLAYWVSAVVGGARREAPETRKVTEELLDSVPEEPLEANNLIKPPVIIIDALDECGSDDSQSVQRNILFNTLTCWSHLHPSIKLVVTSRDKRIPPSFVSVCDPIVLETGDLVSPEENDDIQTFIECRFARIVPYYPSLPPTWPGHSTIKRLTECAAGLFIWAETAIKY